MVLNRDTLSSTSQPDFRNSLLDREHNDNHMHCPSLPSLIRGVTCHPPRSWRNHCASDPSLRGPVGARAVRWVFFQPRRATPQIDMQRDMETGTVGSRGGLNGGKRRGVKR